MAEFIGFVETETPRAFLFQDHFWSRPDWLPKSQVTVFRRDETAEVVIDASDWICKQKEIREFTHRDESEGVVQEKSGG